MFPLFTYPELQKKFCEGFEFLPLGELQQSDDLIYKCYKNPQHPEEIPPICKHVINNTKTYADVLLSKLRDQDIPMTGYLRLRLKMAGYLYEQHYRSLEDPPVIHKQLMGTLEGSHRILNVFQKDILTCVVTLLSSPERGEEYRLTSFNEKYICQLQSTITELMYSINIVYGFMKGCVKGMPGYEDLLLTEEELDAFNELLEITEKLWALQKKTINILTKWKKKINSSGRQQMMN